MQYHYSSKEFVQANKLRKDFIIVENLCSTVFLNTCVYEHENNLLVTLQGERNYVKSLMKTYLCSLLLEMVNNITATDVNNTQTNNLQPSLIRHHHLSKCFSVPFRHTKSTLKLFHWFQNPTISCPYVPKWHLSFLC